MAKLNPSGSALVYSTFLGGPANDIAYGIAVDTQGSAYITGFMTGAGYPTTAGAYDTHFDGTEDAFVTKLNPSGTGLVYSTLLGGAADDEGNDIAVDGQGNAYVAGRTRSSDFPTTAGAYDTGYNGDYDGFVTKLSPSGATLTYSTLFGGAGADFIQGIAIDAQGDAYVTGDASPPNGFPTTPGAYDTSANGGIEAFAAKFNPSGSALGYSTFFGGSSTDTGQDIAVDAQGSAYIVGSPPPRPTSRSRQAHTTPVTTATSTPSSPSSRPPGSALAYSTFLGGDASDHGVRDRDRQPGQCLRHRVRRARRTPSRRARSTRSGLGDGDRNSHRPGRRCRIRRSSAAPATRSPSALRTTSTSSV